MKKNNLNGNGHFKTMADFDGQEIAFPVTFHLKAVMTGNHDDDDNKQKLVEVFARHNIEYRYHNKKVSSKGSYVSFTYKITLMNREQMKVLYADLRKIKELKFAV
jgi:putative lipoic acid-binding regulatory protein